MALNNKREHYIRLFQKTAFCFVIFGLCVFNVVRFCAYTAANTTFVYNYQTPEDTMMKFRYPAPLAVFYTLGEKPRAKMIVLPKSRMAEDPQIKERVSEIMQIYAKGKKKIYILMQNPLSEIAQFLPQAEVFVYGSQSAEKITATFEKESLQKGAFLIWVENLDSEDQTAGRVALAALAQKLNLHPRVFNLIEKETLAEIDRRFAVEGSFDRVAQEQNLRRYKDDYGADLAKYLEDDNAEKPFRLFDRAAVMVVADDGEKQQIFGGFDDRQPLLYRVKNLVSTAQTSLPEASLKVLVLTELFEQKNVIDEQNIIDSLVPQQDGVYIKNGYREAYMLPFEWENYPDKTTFWKQLKIRAGLSPDYWISSTKVYFFRTEEFM